VVNAYQKTIDHALAPGFFAEIERQNSRQFDERIVLINNTEDRVRAHGLASQRLADGEISAFHDVGDLLPNALDRTGLTFDDLGRIPFYSDHVLAAVFVTDAPYLLHWDAEIALAEPSNWIDPSVELLARRPDVFLASPSQRVRERSLFVDEDDEFLFDYGFSDQVFLVRTGELQQAIYNETCPASLRYPTSHIIPIVEQRLDSYMRNHARPRALFKAATYSHDGVVWYWPSTAGEAFRFARNRIVSRTLKLQPFVKSPRWKV
jgi:hypothetical protein